MKKKPFNKFYTTNIILANFAWHLKYKSIIYIVNGNFSNKEQGT